MVGHERGGRLRLHVGREQSLVPVDDESFFGSAAPGAGAGVDAGDKQFSDPPVAVAALFNGDVLNDGVTAAVEQTHATVEKFTNDEGLRVALFEAAQVHQAGRNNL